MKRLWNLVCFCIIWLVVSVRAQSSFYRRTYYNPISSPTTHYYSSHHGNSHDFPPLSSYTSDLNTEETRRKETSKKYAKKSQYRQHIASEEDDSSSERYSSTDYSNEAPNFKEENDSREYSIGTHIRVQHPITVPKKSTSSHYKYTSHLPKHYKSPNYEDLNFSTEAHDFKPSSSPTKKHHSSHNKYAQFFDADPFHVVSPPKPTLSANSPSSSHGYSATFDSEQDDYELQSASSNRAKAQLRDRFKGVASKKQIEKYLEDQQKLLDEALKLQLLNNPKYQHLVKSKDIEQQNFYEGEFEEFPIGPQPPPIYRQNYDDNLTFKSNRPRRRPKGSELKRSPKAPKPPAPPIAGPNKRRFRPSLVINV